MDKHDERKEILKHIDKMAEQLRTLRNRVINYEYDQQGISDAQVLLFDGHELKHMIHEAKIANEKK